MPAPLTAPSRPLATAQGLRELVQNWRDGAYEAAKRLQPGVRFDDLRCMRSPGRGAAGTEIARIYLNGGAPGGDTWVAPVYLLAQLTWCGCAQFWLRHAYPPRTEARSQGEPRGAAR